MAGFKYASGVKRAGGHAWGLCDRCGLRYDIDQMRTEKISAKGSPEDTSSHLRVCLKCYDKPHPYSKLPFAIKSKLPDAEVLRPEVLRPDQFPNGYAIAYNLPWAIYPPKTTINIGIDTYPCLFLSPGFTGTLIGTGTIPGNSLSFTTDNPDITIPGFTLLDTHRILVSISISGATPAGVHTITINSSGSGSAQTLPGIVNVT